MLPSKTTRSEDARVLALQGLTLCSSVLEHENALRGRDIANFLRIYKDDLDPLSIGEFLGEPDLDDVSLRAPGIGRCLPVDGTEPSGFPTGFLGVAARVGALGRGVRYRESWLVLLERGVACCHSGYSWFRGMACSQARSGDSAANRAQWAQFLEIESI